MKPKRRKPHKSDRPLLSVISLDDNEVECQLKTAKQTTVTFKFNVNEDEPSEIAQNLVSIANSVAYLPRKISQFVEVFV